MKPPAQLAVPRGPFDLGIGAFLAAGVEAAGNQLDVREKRLRLRVVPTDVEFVETVFSGRDGHTVGHGERLGQYLVFGRQQSVEEIPALGAETYRHQHEYRALHMASAAMGPHHGQGHANISNEYAVSRCVAGVPDGTGRP